MIHLGAARRDQVDVLIGEKARVRQHQPGTEHPERRQARDHAVSEELFGDAVLIGERRGVERHDDLPARGEITHPTQKRIAGQERPKAGEGNPDPPIGGAVPAIHRRLHLIEDSVGLS